MCYERRVVVGIRISPTHLQLYTNDDDVACDVVFRNGPVIEFQRYCERNVVNWFSMDVLCNEGHILFKSN